MLEYGKEIFAFQVSLGYSRNLIAIVESALQSLPMKVESITDHSEYPFSHPEINDVVATWHYLTSPMILERMLTRKGVDAEKIKKEVEAFRETSLEMARRGQIFQQTICTLAASKKGDSHL